MSSNLDSILELGRRLRRADRYQSLLRTKVLAKNLERTILGIPCGEGSIAGMMTRFNRFKEIIASTEGQDRSLGDIIAEVCPRLNTIYKFTPHKQIDEHEHVPELMTVLSCIKEIDGGRYAGATPRSANVPLETYFGPPVYSPLRSRTPPTRSPSRSTSAARSPLASLPSLSPTVSRSPSIVMSPLSIRPALRPMRRQFVKASLAIAGIVYTSSDSDNDDTIEVVSGDNSSRHSKDSSEGIIDILELSLAGLVG